MNKRFSLAPRRPDHRTALGGLALNTAENDFGRDHLNSGKKASTRKNWKRQSMAVPGRHGRGDINPFVQKINRAARLSMGGRQSLNTSRHSIGIPHKGGRGRRSSVYAAGGSMIKQDPRPVGSKGFTHKCIRSLVAFLAERQYDYAVSPKVLMRPTGKDYQNIMHFLFCQLDPNFKFGKKYVDDIPYLFKGLHYPFNISKTALSAVGSPHTWPALLASIAWFIEILSYDEVVAHAENAIDPMSVDEGGERAFFAYLKNAYQSFLCGDDAMYEQLDRDLVATFEERDAMVQKEVDESSAKNEELRQRLEELMSEKSSLPKLEKRKKDLSADLAKFEKLIVKLEKHKEQLLSKLEARRAEEASKADDLASAKQTRATLETQLYDQELKPADVERMKDERLHLRSAADAVDQEHESFQKRMWELEMELSNVSEELFKQSKEYNNYATRMMLIKQDDKKSSGVDFEMKVDASAYDRGESIIETDIRGTIKPALAELKELAIRRTHDARAKCLDLKDQVDRNEEERTEQVSQSSETEAKLKKIEEAYRREKNELDMQMQAAAEATERCEAEIHEMRTGQEKRVVEEVLAEVRRVQQAIREEEAAYARSESKLEQEMHVKLNEFVEHKQHVETMLADHAIRMAEFRREASAIANQSLQALNEQAISAKSVKVEDINVGI